MPTSKTGGNKCNSLSLSRSIPSHLLSQTSASVNCCWTEQEPFEQDVIGVPAQMWDFWEGRGDFSWQELEFTLFLVGLFWAELLRRIKQRATNPGPSLPLRSLPSPCVQLSGGKKQRPAFQLSGP